MKNKIRVLLVITALLVAQLACNLPFQAGQSAQVPAPNQTLTALFALTPAETATPTLPLIITATAAAVRTTTAAPTTAAVQPTLIPVPTQIVITQPAAQNPTATKSLPQPTSQPIATATAPVAAVRTQSQVIAKYLTTAPTIDGDWSEWKDITTEYPANSVVFGKANWQGENDLSASFHIGWDNNFLYIAAKVRDDTYVQNATGENLYKGDSLEILFDRLLQQDYYYNRLSPDDFQLGISPGRPDPAGAKEAYLWLPANIAGSRPNVKIASLQESGVYRVEAAIPWNVLETTPSAGTHYGFAFSVSDNDDPTQNIQQSMVSNDPSRSLVDPTTWGDLQLVK